MSVRVLSHLPRGLVVRAEREVPDVEVVQVPEHGPIDPDVRGEVLLTQAWGSPNLGDVVARGVRWVHCYGTGVDAFPYDALGDQVQVEARAHGNDGNDQACILRTLVELDYEATVDLQLVQREAAEVGQRRITGTKVIHGQADAQVLEILQL